MNTQTEDLMVEHLTQEIPKLAKTIGEACDRHPAVVVNGARAWVLSEVMAQLNKGDLKAAIKDFELWSGMVHGMLLNDCQKIREKNRDIR